MRLCGLLKRCLTGDYVRPALDPLTPEMRVGLLQALPQTLVSERCGCGDEACRSFKTKASPVTGEPLFDVRLLVNGELVLTCDARGTLFEIEWLPSESTDPILSCYIVSGNGFEVRPPCWLTCDNLTAAPLNLRSKRNSVISP